MFSPFLEFTKMYLRHETERGLHVWKGQASWNTGQGKELRKVQ